MLLVCGIFSKLFLEIRKMGKCNACGLDHPKPGEKSCRFLKEAKDRCKSLGVSEEDWKLYLDEDRAARETAESLNTNPPVIKTEEMDLKKELQQQRQDMDSLILNVAEMSRQVRQLVQIGNAQGPVAGPAGAGLGTTGVTGVTSPGVTAPLSVTPPVTTGSTMGSNPRATHGSGPAVPPAVADLVSTPLTAALQQLTTSIDPDSASKAAGIVLRPEFYCQFKDNNVLVRNLDPKKMSYHELLYGMCCVAKHIATTGGNIESYLDHMI